MKELITQARIGSLHGIGASFSYSNLDPKNIRNKPELGGGAMMDIGCYPIFISRFILGEEPTRVLGVIDRDPEFGIDRSAFAILDFPSGRSTFTCSTQMVPYQRMQFLGSSGRIEAEIPFNIPLDSPTRIFIDDGSDLYGRNIEVVEFAAADQYTIQADLFSKAIREGGEPTISLENSIANMVAIDAVFRSAAIGRVVELSI